MGNEKKNKKKFVQNRFWATAKIILLKKKLYCKGPIVLQRRRDLRADCIAIQYFVL